MAATAQQQVGCAYVWGGTSCDPGFDCSGNAKKRYTKRSLLSHVLFSLPLFRPTGMVYFCYNSSCPDAQLPRVSYQQCATGSNNGCTYARDNLLFLCPAFLRSFSSFASFSLHFRYFVFLTFFFFFLAVSLI